MTVEIKLQFNSVAEAAAFLAGSRGAEAPKVEIKPVPEKPKAETPKPPAPTPKAETPKAETPKAETPKAETPKGDAVDYATLQKAVFRLAAKDKARATSIAQGLGQDTFKALDSSQYAEALKQVEAAIAELG